MNTYGFEWSEVEADGERVGLASYGPDKADRVLINVDPMPEGGFLVTVTDLDGKILGDRGRTQGTTDEVREYAETFTATLLDSQA